MQYKVITVLLLAACAQADARTTTTTAPVFVGTTCVSWPRETELKLPTDTVAVLEWHDLNKARWKAAHDDCRDKLNRVVRAANARIARQ